MKIYFIGIGGIGMSALARYYLNQGHRIEGSDLAKSEITDDLAAEGIKIYLGSHNKNRITKKIELVIYSAAVDAKNPELEKAKKLGIPAKKYAEALGEITKEYYTICVAGAHGKSTTTAMLSLVLIKAGYAPAVILGTKLKEFGNSNFFQGGREPIKGFKKPLLVLEADEWQASFLNYHPEAAIITNIEEEHLDYYRNFSHILSTFRKFIKLIKPDGILVLNQDDKGIGELKPKKIRFDIKKYFYSLKQSETTKLKRILGIPGQHNVSNALSVLAMAHALGIKDRLVFQVLKSYVGAWRRFEVSQKNIQGKKVTVINDYGHHPTEVKATIRAAKEKFGSRTLWTIFQPHQQQRTHHLFKDFISAFDATDQLILSDIYEVIGREQTKRYVTSRELALAIKKYWQKNYPQKNVKHLSSFQVILNYLKKHLKENDILLIMGAGDIWKLDKMLC